MKPAPTFQEELEDLINRHSKENGSNTPDFILAEYLVNCLATYNIALKSRDKWYRFKPFASELTTPTKGDE